MTIEISEDVRRRWALYFAVGGWTASVVLVLLDLARAVPNFQGLGALVILLVGLAINGTLALLVLRLKETVVGVFLAGMHAAEDDRKSLAKPPDEK